MRSHDRAALCLSFKNVKFAHWSRQKTNVVESLQGLIMLEKELAYLGSVCAAALMKKDLALPIGMETANLLVLL